MAYDNLLFIAKKPQQICEGDCDICAKDLLNYKKYNDHIKIMSKKEVRKIEIIA